MMQVDEDEANPAITTTNGVVAHAQQAQQANGTR